MSDAVIVGDSFAGLDSTHSESSAEFNDPDLEMDDSTSVADLSSATTLELDSSEGSNSGDEESSTEASGTTDSTDSSDTSGSSDTTSGDSVICGEMQIECAPGQVCVEGRCLPGRCQGDLIFDDKRFERAVRYGLGDIPAPVTQVQASELRELLLSGYSDLKLGGIECLTGVQTLALGRGANDLALLQWLPTVEQLRLPVASEASLAAIQSMAGLRQLTIHATELTSIDQLAPFTQLESLTIGNCERLSDVFALANFPELRELDIEGSQVEDISSLAATSSLVTAWLGDNLISDVSPLASHTQLTDLVLWRNQISDISSLAALTRLSELYISNNKLRDLRGAEGFGGINILSIDNNAVESLAPLEGHDSLYHLDAYNNQISDIAAVASLTGMAYLGLSENRIEDLGPIAALPHLSYVHVSGNPTIDCEAQAENIQIINELLHSPDDFSHDCE